MVLSSKWGAGTVVASLVAAVLGSASVGCGESDEAEIRAAFAKLRYAVGSRDYQAVCSLTTNAAQRHIGQIGHLGSQGCVRDVRQLVTAIVERRAVAGHDRPTVDDLTVEGDRATARVRFPGGLATDIPFAIEDGDWKADALYGGLPAARQKDKFRRPG